ncbi:MAG TPA: hypothetical protein DD473_24825 [Planctomycetaceae bacterium]|nr:hypothetical protein [Planctomycetaceae bacterium]|tara:strand:- start:951 stop:1757 length:807 start_codon:yes stop_codon:yes gene_type:complete
MTFDPESEFYSEGIVRVDPSSQRKSFWLVFGSIVFLIVVVVAVTLLPIQNQKRHLAHLRNQGAIVYTIIQPGMWTSLSDYVHKFTDYELPTLEEVRQIHFQKYPVTDQTIASLSRYPELQALSMQSANVSTTALDNVFTDLPELTGLTIINCKKITPDWIQKSRLAHPSVTINYRGTAYLGISANIADPAEKGCIVMYVQPGSAAESSGLLPGDIIIGVEDSEISSFTELVMKLARYSPEDHVRIRISRQEEEIPIICKLNAWSNKEF